MEMKIWTHMYDPFGSQPLLGVVGMLAEQLGPNPLLTCTANSTGGCSHTR